jgi:hypothetical protein
MAAIVKRDVQEDLQVWELGRRNVRSSASVCWTFAAALVSGVWK